MTDEDLSETPPGVTEERGSKKGSRGLNLGRKNPVQGRKRGVNEFSVLDPRRESDYKEFDKLLYWRGPASDQTGTAARGGSCRLPTLWCPATENNGNPWGRWITR